MLERGGGLASYHSCRTQRHVRRLPTRLVHVGAHGGAVKPQSPRYHPYYRCSWATGVRPMGYDKLATARRRGSEVSVHDEPRVGVRAPMAIYPALLVGVLLEAPTCHTYVPTIRSLAR